MNHTKLAATILLALLAGCNNVAAEKDNDEGKEPGDTPAATAAPSSKKTIGKINVQRIFLLAGLSEKQRTKREYCQGLLVEAQKKHQAAIKAKLDELGGDVKKLTDEQKEELKKFEIEKIGELRQAKAKVDTDMKQTNQYLNVLFEHQTKEPIRKVAERHGLEAVLVDQPNLFAFGPAIDITDEVIKEMGIDPSKIPATPQLPTTPSTALPDPESNDKAATPPK